MWPRTLLISDACSPSVIRVWLHLPDMLVQCTDISVDDDALTQLPTWNDRLTLSRWIVLFVLWTPATWCRAAVFPISLPYRIYHKTMSVYGGSLPWQSMRERSTPPTTFISFAVRCSRGQLDLRLYRRRTSRSSERSAHAIPADLAVMLQTHQSEDIGALFQCSLKPQLNPARGNTPGWVGFSPVSPMYPNKWI